LSEHDVFRKPVPPRIKSGAPAEGISHGWHGSTRAPGRARRAVGAYRRNVADIAAIFAEIDRLGGADFLPDGRPEQPAMPAQRVVFEE
jgi:hypothetical protein